MFDTMVAIQRLRKSALCNGLQGERGLDEAGPPGSGGDRSAVIASRSLSDASLARFWRRRQVRSWACWFLG
jgi:hypothetical protein